MSRIRKLAVAGGTFSVALGIGFVMQNGDVLAARFGDARPQSQVPVAPRVVAGTAPAAALTAPVEVAAMPQLAAAGGVAPSREAPADVALVLPAEIAAPAIPDTAFPEVESAPAVVMTIPEAPVASEGGALLALGPDLAIPDGPAARDDAPLTVALETDLPAPGLPETAAPPAVVAPDCTVLLTATTGEAGLVALDLAAPCAPLTQVTFHHQGMMFSGLTDAGGALQVTVPALSEQALFIVDIGGTGGAVAMTDVPDLAGLDRAVLQWQGDVGLDLHAREFGADYGSDGHVWSATPRDAATAIATGSGFLMQLGDPAAEQPLMAQVYTFPRALADQSGDVALTVEAEVTPDNCGREIAAQSIQITPGTNPAALDLVMALPGCDATGELLVLSGMLTDLHLAAN